MYDDRHHTQKDSGPIGLSLMVTVSQIWMIFTIEKAIQIARTRNIPIPRHLTVYMDDCWSLISYPRQGLRSSTDSPVDPAAAFNQCLNDVHPRVQFTREDEIDGAIAFLDVEIKKENNGRLSTSVYRKPSNTNLTIKPNSCQHPNTAIATFKSELCRAYRLCSSEAQTKEEIKFIIDLFVDNGHNRGTLEQVAATYKPPSNTNKRTTNKNKHNCKQKDTHKDIPDNLFDVLPFIGIDLSDQDEFKPYCRIPYIPGGTFHEIRRALNEAGVNTCATAGQKLGQVLCGKNKTHPDQKQKKGIYQLTCTCNNKNTYVGQTIRSIGKRCLEHKKASEKGNFQHSGISQHKETCSEPVEWESPTVLKTMSGKNKRSLAYNLKVREALEIKRQNSGPGQGLNEDFGAYVKTTQWNPVFHTMGHL